jgi:mannose-6-phosphate isomerase-like protein (cupin superfamily)
MSFGVARPDDLAWEERPASAEGLPARQAADLTSAIGLTESRARLWRYPPGARGRRHREMGQEEVFVVQSGTLTMLLGDPADRVEVPAGGVVAVQMGTPLQVRNEGSEELTLLIYGAPPVTGQAEILDDVD